MTNEAVAALFLEMSELLDIRGGDMYRARSFRRAARIIEKLREPLALALQYGRLQKRRGIGDGTIVRIKQMLRTGSCPDLDKLRGEMPTGVRELLAVDGLGPKSVRLIYTHLRIGSIAELEHAARSGALARLPRWGSKPRCSRAKPTRPWSRPSSRAG